MTILPYFFYLYLMLRARAIRFDVTENLEKFLNFRVNQTRP